jgi:DNA topoisomerase-1
VVDREREIKSFTVTTHYGVELLFDSLQNTAGWKAVWKSKAWLPSGQDYMLDKELATKVAETRKVTVMDCQESESRKSPPPPFTTSTLQQAASTSLKLSPKETMAAAQRLYEAGSITYMRTDFPNLSDEAVTAIQEYCRKQNWPVVAKARHWKSKAGAQEAHEAIRPTHIDVESAGETDTEKALYKLIRYRTLATQLEDAVYAVRVVHLIGNPAEDRGPEFEAKGRALVEPGWRLVYGEEKEDEDTVNDDELDNPVPQLQSGSHLAVGSGFVRILKTSPPTRYSEASLVKTLENHGIGRPSTYASILDNIISRGFVQIEKRKLVPTLRGETVINALIGRFGFLDYSYTQEMEERLDAIASGKLLYNQLMQQFKISFDKELDGFLTLHEHRCPDCGKPLRHLTKESRKNGEGYDFWGCTGYPDCTATFDNEAGKPGKRKESQRMDSNSNYKCPKCGKPLIHRFREGKFNFWGCSGYPKCKESFDDIDGKPKGVAA